MENFKFIETVLASTEECVDFLEKNIKSGKWKRIFKFSLHTENTVRVFKHDDGDEVSMITDENNYHFYGTQFFNINLYYLRVIQTSLKPVLKNYYDLDGYGAVYINPFDMKLWVTISDCGCIYSKLPKSKLTELMEVNDLSETKDLEDVFNEYDERFPPINSHEGLSAIKSVELEYEALPNFDEDDDEVELEPYIAIGNLQEL